mmetsp:Transcript_7499/g.23239  ORF Transcript_7499/g.23239 Transcript_7499/m.23239 type:complete len:201 (-) Transcript_7499:767-1369(-)
MQTAATCKDGAIPKRHRSPSIGGQHGTAACEDMVQRTSPSSRVLDPSGIGPASLSTTSAAADIASSLNSCSNLSRMAARAPAEASSRRVALVMEYCCLSAMAWWRIRFAHLFSSLRMYKIIFRSSVPVYDDHSDPKASYAPFRTSAFALASCKLMRLFSAASLASASSIAILPRRFSRSNSSKALGDKSSVFSSAIPCSF